MRVIADFYSACGFVGGWESQICQVYCQKNGYDCGPLMLATAAALARKMPEVDGWHWERRLGVGSQVLRQRVRAAIVSESTDGMF